MKIQSLSVYPIKSCRGIFLREMNVATAGPEGDREWMLVDTKGKFMTQRTLGKMAQVETALDESHLTVAFAGQFFKISRVVKNPRWVDVEVWSDKLQAHEEPVLFSQALSQFLGVECRLVKYMPTTKRMLTSKTEGFEPETRFTDRKPLSLVNSRSVEELNARLESPVEAEVFRANVVYQGTDAYEEDGWERIRIGDVIFSQPRKCGRCKIITLDPKTGEARGAGEPLKTLSTYRRDGAGKINFATLWIPENTGTIRLSDTLEVLA